MLTIKKLRMIIQAYHWITMHTKPMGGELSKLKYLKAARQAIRKAIEEDIISLMSF